MGLFSIFSGDDAKKAAADKAAGYSSGYSTLGDLYGQGRDALSAGFDKAATYYQPMYDTATRGYSALGDALGINGTEGSGRATAAFRANPGYNVQLDTGLEAIDRGAASRGLLTSPSLAASEQKYGNDLASLGWSKFIDALGNYRGDLATSAGGLASTAAGAGAGINASYQGQGAAAYGSKVGQGNAQAEGDMADYGASANMWNAIFNGGKLLASIYGGGAGKAAGAAGTAGA